MHRNLAAVTAALAVGIGLPSLPALARRESVPDAKIAERKPVDLVLCLDTSNSMDGLIDAARRKLWDIVNELARAKPTPRLRVALLSYGNDGYNAETGWVRQETAFTEDLDAVNRQLFALTTNGGTEYVGRVLRVSLDRLDWTPSRDALKLIFVAGNESADQDPNVPFRDVCRRAIAAGVQVNPVYCGRPEDGDAAAWREIASLADGRFAAIDPDHGTVEIPTPYDEKLGRLSEELSRTFLAFGAEGRAAAANQSAQDANAAGASAPAAAARAEAKAGALYRWSGDLVEASKEKGFRLDTVRDEDLPEELKKLTPAEREARVAEAGRKRETLQKEIADLTVQRQAYQQEEAKKQGLDGKDAFDQAVRSAVREQGAKKGLQFK